MTNHLDNLTTMNAAKLLLQRQSNPNLISPAPNQDTLDVILSAAMRVPDHACLNAWQATVLQDKGLQRLSDVFVEIAQDNSFDETKTTKMSKMPFRAPMIIIVSTRYVEHDKVPKQEQLITAGCCVHAMQMAAYALGYGAFWRTGELAYNQKVKKALGIEKSDSIVGFLYIGTPSKELPIKAPKSVNSHITYWG